MRLLVCLFACVLSAGGLWAQPRRLTLPEAVRVALERNLTIRKAETQLELYEVQRRQRVANFLPYVSANSSSGRNFGRQFDLTTGQLTDQRSDRLSASIDASLNLFNGGADWFGWRQAEQELESQRAGLERARQSVVFSVAQSFLQILLDQELLRIEQENLRAQRGQLERIEQLVRSGVRPQADLYAQQAQVAQQELAVIEAENRLALDRARLAQLLGLDSLEGLELVPPEADPQMLEAESFELEALYRAALASRSDYRQRQLALEAARTGLRAATAGYWPRLDLAFSYGSGYSSLARRFNPQTQRLEAIRFGDQFWRQNVYSSVGLRISIPIFDRLLTANNVARNRVQYEYARWELQELEQNIRLELQQALLNYQAAQKRWQVASAQLRAAEQALQAERERYQVGSGTLLELTTANTNYVRAASLQAQARYSLLFQRKMLDYYMGRSDLGVR
ncbi:MAG: TolC family protein [Bacteroidota bacterium]|nr:TolC family protein [Rhodothermia bacterium]MDW8138703.1 TolC family protein [Bacteroidota bacterium]MDW8284711.1 TolC family protein [Bacteroidota bacterium]